MRVISLSIYSLKRLFRHRSLCIALFAAPLLMAAGRMLFHSSHVTPILTWACPFMCILFTASVVFIQYSVDSMSGLQVVLSSSPLSNKALIGARIAAGAAIFIVQMLIWLLLITV